MEVVTSIVNPRSPLYEGPSLAKAWHGKDTIPAKLVSVAGTGVLRVVLPPALVLAMGYVGVLHLAGAAIDLTQAGAQATLAGVDAALGTR